MGNKELNWNGLINDIVFNHDICLVVILKVVQSKMVAKPS